MATKTHPKTHFDRLGFVVFVSIFQRSKIVFEYKERFHNLFTWPSELDMYFMCGKIKGKTVRTHSTDFGCDFSGDT